MLALLQQIGLHVDEDGGFDRSNFKAVYIAPMKALAQEVVSSMSNRLSYLGCVVKELTGVITSSWKSSIHQMICEYFFVSVYRTCN